DTISEMFTDEHALDYSSPPLWDDYDDNLFDVETDFSEVDALSSTNNEDKVFNPGILIHENLFEVTNFATPDKNVKKTTNASLILEDFNPPLYELPFHKEVPGLGALLSFSSKNEEKVFNPGILTSKRVHTSLLPELSHRGTKAFKVTKILKSPMEIFPCSYQEDIRVLDVPSLRETKTTIFRGMRKRISEKRTKNQAKMDKTEHGMEKRGKAKVKSKPKYKKVKVKVNPEEVKVRRSTTSRKLQEVRTAQASGSEPFHLEKSTEEPKELSKEDLKKMLEIVPVEEFRVEALQTKYPIIDWEIHTEDSRKYYKIIRVSNITEAYQSFEDMLKAFDKEDLDTL
ncbi:hypothetical protein Tco_1394206, partial [Tanacetum coccineum]